MKPTAYYLKTLSENGEVIDIEYNGINQFCDGRFGEPLYTQAAIKAAVLAEREACAKVCEEEHDKSKFGVNGMHCAAAIRGLK